MNIKIVDALDAPALTKDLGYTGLDSWCEFIRAVYGYNAYRLVAYENDLLVGALVMVEIKHPLFGHYLTTAPYGSYGGFAFNNTAIRDALLKEAELLAIRLGINYAVVRTLDDSASPTGPWISHSIYCTYRVVLASTTEEMLETFSANHRNHIRKSQKKGMSVRFGNLELLDDAYKGLSFSMHELGSPYHSKTYLRKMAEILGETLEFAVLYDAVGKVAGSGVFITQGDTVSNLHANVLKEKRSSYAGELLYWSVIERSISKKHSIFDLGRSLIGSGNEAFKLKWAERKLPLAYWYWLSPNQNLPSINQRNPKFKAAISIWKRLPAFIVNTIGPYIIRGLA
jgi:serine/alanine adding enzyme